MTEHESRDMGNDPDHREALLRARAEVCATLEKHGLCGFYVLSAGGALEVATILDAPWCKLTLISRDGDTVGFRLHATSADYANDRDTMGKHLAMTGGFVSGVAEVLTMHARQWQAMAAKIDAALGAEHTPLERVRTQ